MTILQKQMRKKGAKKIRLPLKHNRLEQKEKSLWKTLTDRPDLKERPTIKSKTEMIMQDLTENILSDCKGSCGIVRIADALATNDQLKDTHVDKPRSTSRYGRILEACNLIKIDKGLALRYQLTNALNRVKNSKGALNRAVSTWAEVKELFSHEMDFEDEGRYLSITDGRSETALLESTNLFKSPRQSEAPPTFSSPSQRKWLQISATKTPQKISEQTSHEKGPLGRELEIQQAEREEAERKELADVEAAAQRMEDLEREEEAKRMASSVLRDFTEEEEAMVEGAVYGGGPGNEVLQQEGTDSVNRASMRTLQPMQWLNDEVISLFFVMLGKRDEELCRADPNKKRCHFFKSFFMTKLINVGHAELDGVYEYRNVKRWSKKVPGKDIFKLDKIFFPINVSGMHWVCAIAFMQEKRIQFYDSMGADGMLYLESLFKYIQDEHQDKKKSPLPDVNQWQLVPCTADTPRQGNGFDCGVFTCCFADFIAKDCPLLFTQQHVNKCRKRIALSIMLGQAIV